MVPNRKKACCRHSLRHGLWLILAALGAAADTRGQPSLSMSRFAGEIIFAVRQPGAGGHWYENFGYSAFNEQDKLYGAEGRLCRLDLPTGRLEVLIEDPAGAVRDPQVHYDGQKILFSYRRGGEHHFHLFEFDLGNRQLRQLTSGPFDDIEPTYLPDGHILFCSSRCNRWVPCWYSPVAILFRCDADGGNVHPVSANIEHDNTPWPMPDGRVIYERWEYVGCHEQRTRAALSPVRGFVAAMRRPPQPILPLSGIPEVFDFPRDIHQAYWQPQWWGALQGSGLHNSIFRGLEVSGTCKPTWPRKMEL